MNSKLLSLLKIHLTQTKLVPTKFASGKRERKMAVWGAEVRNELREKGLLTVQQNVFHLLKIAAGNKRRFYDIDNIN